MSTTAPKIVITKEELTDARIDEALQLQHKYVPPPVEPAKTKFRLIYSAWFYLMLAGALGAFLAWAIIEPHFNDVTTFTGKVEEVNPDAVPSTFHGIDHEIRGRLKVSGVETYIFPERTRIVEKNTNKLMSLNQLAVGQVITVYGVPSPSPGILIALAIHQEAADKPISGSIDISDLKTTQTLVAVVLFPLVAGMVGLMIGGVEGIVCRTYARAVSSALVGLIAGLIGGAASAIGAGIVFKVLGQVSSDPFASTPAFVFLMFRRGLAWAVAGMAMGLGQGFALKSGKLKFNGFIGGIAGGLLGGLFFDPIDLLFRGPDDISAAASRAVGLTLIGAAVGLLIGFTDLLTRDAWLKVLSGPLQGKEFSFNRTPIRLGSSPKNEIYLFKDSKIDPVHAEINKLRDAYEIVDNNSSTGTFVNGRRVQHERLVDGVQIKIGNSEFAYSSRENKAG